MTNVYGKLGLVGFGRAARTRLLGSFTRETKRCVPLPPSLICIIASRVRLMMYIETDRESQLGFSYTYV